MMKKYLLLFAVSFLIAGIFSYFASSSPDGLEKVAEDQGFIEHAIDHPIQTFLSDYKVAEIDNDFLSTSIAGIIGVIASFCLIGSIAILFLLKKDFK